MKSGIWQLAIPSLLCLSLAAQAQPDDRPQDELRGASPAQQSPAERQQQRQIQQQQNQQRNVEHQQQQQIYQQQREQQHQIQQQYDQQRQVERQQERQIQQQQDQMRNVERQQQQQIYQQQREQERQIQQQQNQQRNVERQQQQQIYQQQREQQRQIQEQQNQQRQQLRQSQDNLPIQGRPDQVWQTQPPRQGHYQDLPRDQRPRDNWPGRPDGRGDGWGGGPRYQPGHSIDRLAGSYARIPWRGQDYFYTDGYWYRPQGGGYVVVTPPYGVRVRSLPGYAREVWVDGSLLFMAAGVYYAWQDNTQDYVVVNPPRQPDYNPPPRGNGYDPVFYPVPGQTPQQVEYDRYQCYRWAVDQSGFDPASMSYQPSPEVVDTYRRSMGECLYERGYNVQ